jgi:type III secretion system HrpB7-like protein
MKNPRIQAFKVILQRRERIDGTLRDRLAQQQHTLGEFMRQAEEKKSLLEQHAAQRASYDDRIRDMQTEGTVLDIGQFNQYREYLGVVVERLKQTEVDLTRLDVVVQRHAGEVGATRAEIIKNERQIELYRGEIRKIKATLEQASELAQEEEVEESFAARWVRQRREIEAGKRT